MVSLGAIPIHQKWGVIIRETTSEIKKVFDKHQYSIDSIVFDVTQTFKLHSIVRHTRFEKQEGYAVTEILALLILFPLMLVRRPEILTYE